MIEAENAVWAKALREKMLTLERIFQWPDQTLIEVMKSLPQKNLALALVGIKEEHKARILAFYSAAEKRRLDDILAEAPAKPADISANMVKVIEMTRKMLVSGDLRPEKFDEGLVIPEEFESKLDSQGVHSYVQKTDDDSPGLVYHGVGSSDPSHPPPTLEIAQMQRTLAALVKENKILKDELRSLREKLDHIKRIA